jgi:prepilin-type N-terminal cleavage/methylation domain-containing protein
MTDRNRGFTIVEMLVVIAIILLMIAIVMPVIRSVRSMAQRVVCMSNMEQLFMGFKMYANDNRGCLPYVLNGPPGAGNCMDWLGYKKKDIPKAGTIWQYILEEKVYLCPADSKWRDPSLNVCWTPSYATHSYAVCDPRSGVPLDKFGADKALMVDESERTINDGRFVNKWDTFASRHVISGWGQKDRARAGGHIMFCDGTVKFFMANDIIGANDPMFK